MYQTELIDTTKLKPFPIREIRPAIIERIKARIESAGYNPSRPLSVVKQNGSYISPALSMVALQPRRANQRRSG